MNAVKLSSFFKCAIFSKVGAMVLVACFKEKEADVGGGRGSGVQEAMSGVHIACSNVLWKSKRQQFQSSLYKCSRLPVSMIHDSTARYQIHWNPVITRLDTTLNPIQR